VARASSTVLHFLDTAHHDRRLDAWFEPGAISTVSLADGSARETMAAQEALPESPAEDAGSRLMVRFVVDPGSPGNPPTTIDFYAPYLHTWGGIRGRDL
jgi:hypothetical protein